MDYSATTGTGHIDPFWDDGFTLLPYKWQGFNNHRDLDRWRREGYTQPVGQITGELVSAQMPQPAWTKDLNAWVADTWNVRDVTTTFYRMKTGTILPIHSDTYARYTQLFDTRVEDVVRVLLMPGDWRGGHYLEVEGRPYVDWRAGDYFWWWGGVPHTAANIGVSPRYSIQITGHR